jgi:predicted transcriptional regulator
VPKLTKGEPLTITLSPYIKSQLDKLVEQKQVSKSAIITMAIEQYSRAEERREKEQAAK